MLCPECKHDKTKRGVQSAMFEIMTALTIGSKLQFPSTLLFVVLNGETGWFSVRWRIKILVKV